MAIGGCEVSYCFFKNLHLVGMKIVGRYGCKMRHRCSEYEQSKMHRGTHIGD